MNKHLTFAVLATMLASCANNDEPAVVTEGNAPITVTAGVTGLATRAGYEGTTTLPETFYLSITQDATDETSRYNYTDVLMTKVSGENEYTPETTMVWKDGHMATYPITAYTTKETTFSVETDQSTEKNILASDLLGANRTGIGDDDDITISNFDLSVNINFRHLLCKLDVEFTPGSELGENPTVTIDKVTLSGLNRTVTLDRDEATVTSDENSKKTITMYVDNTNSKAEVIFAPSTSTDAHTITITTTINNVVRTFTATINPPTGGFLSGYCYTASLTLGGTLLSDVTTNATGWTDGTEDASEKDYATE